LAYEPSPKPTIWTAKEGIKELKDRQGNTTPAQAKAVSGDGSIVVGQKKTKGKNDYEAFIWTKAGGIESLSTAFPSCLDYPLIPLCPLLPSNERL
jgi:uncharacterized membrane protein